MYNINTRVRALLIDKVRNARPKVWPLVVAQVWNKVDEKVHEYCSVRSSVNNSVIQHLLILKRDNT